MRRQIFEMTAEQYATLMAKFKAAHANGVENSEPLVDAAWDELGEEMGFEGITARCHLGNPRIFTACPKEKADVDTQAG